MIRSRYRVGAALLLPVFLTATPSTSAPKQVRLAVARAAPAEASLLDVQIAVFEHAPDFFPELRRAEARFLPVSLRRALERSGFWGVVRVVPDLQSADVAIQGRVIASHGGRLELAVRVVDATGNEWLDETYERDADASVYLERDASTDPFQSLLHHIANDVSKKYRKLDADELRRIRETARLRFAREIAPDAFADYVARDTKGRYAIRHSPSDDDPMIARVDAIRLREAGFVDMLDAHYARLFESMEEAYRGWRSQDYWQREAMKNGPPTATRSGGRNAPLGVLIAGQDGRGDLWGGEGTLCGTPAALGRDPADARERWAEREPTHLDVLRELGASLADDVAPVLVEVEGDVSRLTGSAEAQYAAWRTLLRRIFSEESGLPALSEESSR